MNLLVISLTLKFGSLKSNLRKHLRFETKNVYKI